MSRFDADAAFAALRAYPGLRVTTYEGGHADVYPLVADPKWSAVIRGKSLLAFNDSRLIARATPWWELCHGPLLLVEAVTAAAAVGRASRRDYEGICVDDD
jgi:hypothetical protein